MRVVRRPRGFAGEQRLRRPAEFAAVLAAPRRASLRATARWLAMTAAWSPMTSATAAGSAPEPMGIGMGTASARLGLTISRRMARRSVDRTLVKRIAREAFRHAAEPLDRAAASVGMRIDLNLRLARALPLPGAPARPALATLKRELRADADELVAAALQRMAAQAVASTAGRAG